MSDAGVVITLEKIYDKLVELEMRLGDHPKQLDDHERRLRNLEARVWGFAGVSTVVAAVVSVLIGAFK